MSPSGSVMLISKMDFFQSLIILIAYTDALYARTQLVIPLQKKEYEIQKNLLPKHESESYFPVKLDEEIKGDSYLIPTVNSSNNLLPSLDQEKESKPKTPADIETAPTTLFLTQEIRTEPEKRESMGYYAPYMFPDLTQSSLSKRTVSQEENSEESQHSIESSSSKNVALAQNPSSAPLANKEYKSAVSSYCIKLLQNGSYYPIPIAHILPAHEHDPLPPLPGEIQTGQLHVSEEVSKLNEPLPPLSNHISTGVYHTLVPVKTAPEKLYPPTIKDLPQKSVQDPLLPLQSSDTTIPLEKALPITDSSIPAAVVPSGPYPAADSILKEMPIVHLVAEPLPPLQNAAFTNVEIPKISTLHVPKGPYPANLPVGSPYPPSI
ncbi:uncharacterized protein LOC123678737 [Harmonia axyridis]|uniref:uncharacterized protein LOC123678737 n=1 Tax=Harmonia axyridis TaxID=115357 RepID=UPI001E277B1F|nr:uncharacterized protein LOC123678737 [Harmonia axyridis]